MRFIFLVFICGNTFIFSMSLGVEEKGNGTNAEVLTTEVEESTTENNILDNNYNNNNDLPVAEKLIRVRPKSRCFASSIEGACYTSEECFRRGGQMSGTCDDFLFCCTFLYTCGDVSPEKVTYFRSPNYPTKSVGSLACDYDVAVQKNTCAVRIDYDKVNLARKLGGVCDIDQIFILNSIDGPTAGQCGPLSGYSTTVAVNPGQPKPVKLAVLIQNEATYHWEIKITQLACNQVKHFRPPVRCGEVRNDVPVSSVLSRTPLGQELHHNLFSWHENKWKNAKQPVWWSYPEPIFNTFYYGSTKRHLQQHGMRLETNFNRRVVSGSDAMLGEFPWVAAVGLDHMFFCGGALINDRFVLTAAHCLMARDTPIGSLVVHLGDHDLTRSNETIHLLRGVRKVLFHSHFHPFLLSNDIALLQLDEPVLFSDTVQPVCLPFTGDSFTGDKATVVGWGVTSFPMGEPSPVLQKLEVETLSNYQCSRVIEEPVTLGMLCAAPTSLQGTCFGDSGGPLTVENKDGRHTLIGVVSFGVTGCAVMPAFPDLYTRVSEYIKWVQVNAM